MKSLYQGRRSLSLTIFDKTLAINIFSLCRQHPLHFFSSLSSSLYGFGGACIATPPPLILLLFYVAFGSPSLFLFRGIRHCAPSLCSLLSSYFSLHSPVIWYGDLPSSANGKQHWRGWGQMNLLICPSHIC